MNQHIGNEASMFELMGRQWSVQSPVRQICFGADRSSIAFLLDDGSIRLAEAADNDSAEARTRIDTESGRMTIRRRKERVRPLVVVGAPAEGSPILTEGIDSEYLIGQSDGEIRRMGADGRISPTGLKTGAPIVAMDCRQKDGRLAFATPENITLASGYNVSGSLKADAACALRISPDGALLACAIPDHIVIFDTLGACEARARYALPAKPTDIIWSPNGSWVSVALETSGFALIDLARNRFGAISGFPSAVQSIGWARQSDRLFASGAFRIVAWSLAHPPFDGDHSGALETGRARLVATRCLAVNPRNDVVAVGYENGHVILARPGSRDELIVGAFKSGVTSLAWSSDGKSLAAGGRDEAAIIGFPPVMFK
ncbi:WD40 repeat domain-containing protein [Rhodoblastus sp. 17X3]|uniref:WD40 repeat domain-containing protein n=1 Tax=Rhodoblastus sp. 17X3 TaxID=3047026 RepID=UPI0024B7E064|nr:WD40 repeat domain-containing protein [Rhodoblastus sp. 17X3]MDI9847815.1 WD40 repeat domain-containing protein [Rhodoblastus sp. 17X3]